MEQLKFQKIDKQQILSTKFAEGELWTSAGFELRISLE